MAFQGDSIYWVEVEKVVPNPFQPRREFDENKLQELAESIRMYGVLQPLTVTRREIQREDGTFYSEYELIAGERRLRASKLAGISQVPVLIRDGEQSEQEKLELAIIENLQREDLNAIDRALAFQQLAEQFGMNHAQVGKKVGRSREYVANSIRLLQLPEHMMDSVRRGELGEGHARTLLMLSDRPEEQETLFRETLLKKLSVRELERITRKIATERVRKPSAADIDQHLIEFEKEFTETLGTRVQIQKTEFGGKLTIDYFSDEDLAALLERVRAERGQPVVSSMPPPVVPAPQFSNAHTTPAINQPTQPTQPAAEPAPTPPAADPSLLQRLAAHTPLSFGVTIPKPASATEPAPTATPPNPTEPTPSAAPNLVSNTAEADMPSSPAEPEPSGESDEDLYSLRNFTV